MLGLAANACKTQQGRERFHHQGEQAAQPENFKAKGKGKEDDEHPGHGFTETEEIGGPFRLGAHRNPGRAHRFRQPAGRFQKLVQEKGIKQSAADAQPRRDDHAGARLFDDFLFDWQAMGEQDERRKNGDISHG